jgi:hypothetical protein
VLGEHFAPKPALEANTPIVQEQGEGILPFKDIVDGFREVVAPREFGTLSAHVNLKLIDEWFAQLLAVLMPE